MNSDTPTVQILIADGQSIFCEGLRSLLESVIDFKVVSVAADGLEALSLVKQHKPDLLLTELILPHMPGEEILLRLAASSEKVRCVVVTSISERSRLAAAIESGAHGIVQKDSNLDVLIRCMRQVLAGKYWVGNQAHSERDLALQSLRAPTCLAQNSPTFGLTKREMEIISTVVSGHTNREVSRRYSISEETVKHHLSNIFDKLGVFNRLELALFAVHHRLVGKSRSTDGSEAIKRDYFPNLPRPEAH